MSWNNRRRGKRPGARQRPDEDFAPEDLPAQDPRLQNQQKQVGKPFVALAPQPQARPLIQKNEKGVFDFTEAELAQDTSLRLITADTCRKDVKYANFEEYLKDHCSS